MLYLKNSLVNLTIILFSLFFLVVSSADDSAFIFPKKKITTTNSIKKLIEIEKRSISKSTNLPRKKPIKKAGAFPPSTSNKAVCFEGIYKVRLKKQGFLISYLNV